MIYQDDNFNIFRLLIDSQDDEGYDDGIPSVVGNFVGDLQPVSGEQVLKEYGITDEKIRFRIFTPVGHGSKENDILEHIEKTKFYDVLFIQQWDNHNEILLGVRVGN